MPPASATTADDPGQDRAEREQADEERREHARQRERELEEAEVAPLRPLGREALGERVRAGPDDELTRREYQGRSDQIERRASRGQRERDRGQHATDRDDEGAESDHGGARERTRAAHHCGHGRAEEHGQDRHADTRHPARGVQLVEGEHGQADEEEVPREHDQSHGGGQQQKWTVPPHRRGRLWSFGSGVPARADPLALGPAELESVIAVDMLAVARTRLLRSRQAR